MLGGVVTDQGGKGKVRLFFDVLLIQVIITTIIRCGRQNNEWTPKDTPCPNLQNLYVMLHGKGQLTLQI